MPFRTSIFYEVISFIGIILTSILIFIIITKTPAAMKQFKIYLLLYSCHLLCLQITCGVYAPSILHPYIFFYPMGIAKNFPPNISATIFVFTFFNAMSMYDCIIAMVMERYYAMKSLGKSKIAASVYFGLTASSYCYLFFGVLVIFFKPLHYYFMISPDANTKIIGDLFQHLDDEIVTDSVIIFQNLQPNELPPFVLLICVIIGFRIIFIIVYLISNAFLSKDLSHNAVSQNLQHHTSMLIKMIIFQLIGIISFTGIPIITVIIIASFVHQSNAGIITHVFTILCFFGIYDSIVTIICIKPYRIAVAEFVSFWSSKRSTAVGTLTHQSRIKSISLQT